MNAIITLVASLLIAVFFLGPHLAARFAIERLVVKQPAKAQTSTEEFGRALFFSVPFVGIAALLVWLYSHTRYVFDPDVLDGIFASNTSKERWSALHGMWPVRDILVWTYLEVLTYVFLVWFAVRSYARKPRSARIFSLDRFSRFVTSPYLKSEWDVLARGILLPPSTEMLADVETKSGKIFLGTLEGVKTNADGSLRHLQLSKVSIRVQKGGPTEMRVSSRMLDEPYVFRDSFYFVILAGEISNINLRFALPEGSDLEGLEGPPQTTANPTPSAPTESQVLREQSLEEGLTGLSEAKKRELMEQLGSPVVDDQAGGKDAVGAP